jgi:hypothetical protein
VDHAVVGDFLAWSDSDAQRESIERRLNQLVGPRVEVVRYVEIRYEGHPEPMWRGPDFDSLDYGLELDLDDGLTWSVIWKQAGANEALLVYPGTLVPTELKAEADTATWDATSRWHERGLMTLNAVTPVWTRHRFGPAVDATGRRVADGGESDLCLLTCTLEGNDGREAILTLGERDPNGRFRYTADNVAVFFDRAEARDARVLLPGDPDALL